MSLVNIRTIELADIPKLRKIHEKHFKGEFAFPDFATDFHCVFTITDGSGDIITIGGVKAIAEAITITDKDKSTRLKREALIQLMQACEFTTKSFNYNQFHVFIQDETYEQQLLKYGFYYSKGQCLVKDI